MSLHTSRFASYYGLSLPEATATRSANCHLLTANCHLLPANCPMPYALCACRLLSGHCVSEVIICIA